MNSRDYMAIGTPRVDSPRPLGRPLGRPLRTFLERMIMEEEKTVEPDAPFWGLGSYVIRQLIHVHWSCQTF